MTITVNELTTVGVAFTLFAVATIILHGVIVPYIKKKVSK